MCAGTHAPGRGEEVEWSRRWLGEIVTAGGSCRACKGQSQCQVVEKLSHILSEGGEGRTVFANYDGRDGSKQIMYGT